jgi:two-component system chemotaxis response regulator CheY
MAVRPRTVLLVDDSAELRRIVRERYEGNGFVIVGEAEDGSAAIGLAIKHRPDLIVLDLMMPVRNGFQTAPELLRVLPNAIVILYSIYGDSPSIQKRALALGIRAVVQKSDFTRLISESKALSRDLE